MIFDQKLEHHLISGLLRKPNEYLTIQSFFSEDDIYSEDSLLRRTILSLIRQAVEKGEGESVDAMIIAQRLEGLGIKFDEEIPVGQFVESLALRNVPEGSVYKAAVELKKLSLRRKLLDAMERASEKLKKADRSASLVELEEIVDKEINSQMNVFDSGENAPSNIYEKMESVIEERGNNPVTDFGMLGPFPTVNKIYGSLVREGNVTVICARAKGGKSTLAMDYTTYVADKYDVDVLHLDNGEMSEQELIFRQASSLSGVPLYLLETGKWRNAGEEIVNKVRSVWKRIKKLRFYYYCVGGMPADEMVAFAKRFYYNKVGRGKRMIISFDYLKTTGQWQVVGEIVDKFKKLIAKEIVFDNKPMVSMFTSVQSNRSGIVTNKKKENITDDESVVSLSDRIIQYCSHMFLLRKKTMDEILEDGEQFGTHKLICFAARHLGEDVSGELEPVKIGDKLEKNCIFLEFSNFRISEKGDLRKLAGYKNFPLEESKTDDPTSF
jgi:replicative DNA helicase